MKNTTRKVTVKLESTEAGKLGGTWRTYRVRVGSEQHGRITLGPAGEVLDGTVFLTDDEAAAALRCAREAHQGS